MLDILFFAGILISLSFIIIIHEAGHFFVGKLLKFPIKEFGFGYPPRLWTKKFKDTVYSINWILFGGFVRFFDHRIDGNDGGTEENSFSRQKIWKRASVMGAGIFINFLLGWLLVSFIFMVGVPAELLVTQVQSNSIAEQNGIKSGDIIIDFQKVNALTGFLEEQKGKEVILDIKRADTKFSIKFISPLENNGGRLGVFLSETGVEKQNFFMSFIEGFKTSAMIMYGSVLGLVKLAILAIKDVGALNSVVGPVGIVSIAVETSKLGFIYFIQVMAMISLGLAAFNIFPIPGLDGGRLFLILVEKIKGSPISEKAEIRIFGISFLALALLAIFVTVKDIWMLF